MVYLGHPEKHLPHEWLLSTDPMSAPSHEFVKKNVPFSPLFLPPFHISRGKKKH
jgi:hypothetical protein